jgi:hypothetical protein
MAAIPGGHSSPRPEPSLDLLEDHHNQITKLSHSINAIGQEWRPFLVSKAH